MKESSLGEFIKKNAWSILALIFVAGSFTAMVQFKFMAVQAQVDNLSADVDKLTNLVERVIVLEQHDVQIKADIAEIKTDVKTLIRR